VPDRDKARDRGIATVWTATAVAAVMCLGALVFGLGTVLTIRHDAESAADLAALAAAGAATSGSGPACERAKWIADRMGVELASCRLEGWDALVEVRTGIRPSSARFPPELGVVTAHARAGPAGGGR
jgi:secretion/DNA translocation related TadE-like protein